MSGVSGSLRRRPGVIQGLALVFPCTTSVMGSAILAPNIPHMIAAFNYIPDVQFWVPAMVTLPALCIALFSTAAGAIADIVGRRRIMIIAMIVYGFVGMAPIVLQNFWLIFASRLVVGMMEAIIMTSSTVLIGDYFTGARRDHWLAMQTTVAACSSLVMFPLGGFVGQFGWQYPFGMYGFSLALVFLVTFTTWEPAETGQHAKRRFPVLPALGIMVLAGGITYLASRFFGWLTPIVLFAVCLGVLLAIGITARKTNSSRADSGTSWAGFPWIKLAGISAVTAASSIMFFLLQIEMAQVLAETGITNSLNAGMIITVVSLGIPIGTVIFSRISRLPIAVLVLIDFLTMACGFWGMAVAPNYQVLMAASFLNQCGCGLALPTMLTWAMRQFTFNQRGRGIGIWTSFFNGGQFVGPAFVTWLATALTMGMIKPAYEYIAYWAAAMAAGALGAIVLGKGMRRVIHAEDGNVRAISLH